MPERFEPGPPTSDMPETTPETVRDPELSAALRHLDESKERYVEQMDSRSEAERKKAHELYQEAAAMQSFLVHIEKNVALGQSRNWREEMQQALEMSPQYEREASEQNDLDEVERIQRQYRMIEKYSKVLTPENLRRYMA